METTFGTTAKILVVGTSGSGKTTLAGKIAKLVGIKDIELDALHWGPRWTEIPQDVFKEKLVKEIESNTGYVIHGNYNSVRDITWGAVDTVIWLDYSRMVVMWRVVTRTVRRIITQEELWAGNVESIKKSFFEKDSIIVWAWNTYGKRKEQYRRLFEDNPYHIKKLVRFTKPREARAFLKRLEEF